MIDIQKQLDNWLEDNPDAQQYVSALIWVPDAQDVPDEVTHIVSLRSAAAPERALLVGAVVLPKFAAFLDGLLAAITTQPPQ